jgi:hypothetical protein
MFAEQPVLITAEELTRLFGLDANEVRRLVAQGLLVEVGSFDPFA